MYRVLLVTDDWASKKRLKSELLERGFSIVPVESAEVMRDAFVPPSATDLVVFDVEQCASDPGKLCRWLKRERTVKDLPLLLLITEAHFGRVDVQWGMDDYLTLPVTAARLAERLKFLLWKRDRIETKNGFSHGGLVVDFERYEVHVRGQPVDLTYKEFELLKFLVTHPGRVFTREELLDKVWGYDYYGGTRTVDVHVRRLRAKIEIGGASYVETVRNVGYKFLGA